MEPLSLTTNIISIVGAAKNASKKLEKLVKLRHAPQQVLSLFNEVSDFRAVLAMVQELDENLKLQEHYVQIEQYLATLLHKADKVLRQINIDPEQHGVVITAERPSESVVLKWKQWIKNHNLIAELSKEMRNIRIEIAGLLTLLNVTEVHQLRISLSDISLTYNQISNRIVSSEASINNLRPTLNSIQSTLQTMQSDVTHLSRNSVAQHAQTSSQTLRVRTSIEKKCSRLCKCSCHQPMRLSSPVWLNGLVGLLFIGYTGNPILNRTHICSERLCYKNSSSLLTVNYYFPCWFLSRMIELRDRWTPTDSHMLTVRTPRVVRASSPIFRAAQLGNLELVQMLFSQGKASPFDVNDSGISPLMYSIRSGRPEACKLLLDSYADPEHEDMVAQSAIDWAFDKALLYGSNHNSKAVYDVFKSYHNPDEYLRKKKFTVIHQIVVGLIQFDLRLQLDITTSEIDAKDSLGRTPLHWAVKIPNIYAVEVLLEYGASVTILADLGVSVFQFALPLKLADDNTTILALLLGSFLSSKDIPPRTFNACRILENTEETFPTCKTCDNHAIAKLANFPPDDRITVLSSTAIRNLPNHTRMLLAHGTLIDSATLLYSVRENAHQVLPLLLQSGTQLDVVDCEDRQTLLHVAAVHSDLTTLDILINFRTAITGWNDRDIYGHTPLDSFDIARKEWREESDAERQACREAFLCLLEISKLAAFRDPTDEWARLCELEIKS